MKIKKFSFVSTVAIGLLINASAYAQSPMNLTSAKHAVIKYYESKAFEKDVHQSLMKAESYLQKRMTENNDAAHPRHLAIVFDIDDTVLSNFPKYKNKDFAHTHEIIDAGFHDANAPAIKPMLNFYNKALKNGVQLFFITGRPDDVRAYTITNLQKAGYYGWTALYLPKGEETKLPAQIYKAAVRQKLTQQGYDIVLNVGDQESDFIGGYAEQTVKIPNPLYSLPEEAKMKEEKAMQVTV